MGATALLDAFLWIAWEMSFSYGHNTMHRRRSTRPAHLRLWSFPMYEIPARATVRTVLTAYG
jgi:hypothetical protein